MFNFLKKIAKPKIIGLQILQNDVRLAQKEKDKFKTFSTKKNQIKKTLKEKGVKIKYASLALPERDCFIKVVPYPEQKESSKDEDLSSRKDIKQEIHNNIPVPIKKIYYRCQQINGSLFIAAALKKTVDKHLKIVNEANLIPANFEPSSLSLSRAILKNSKPSKEEDFLIINKENGGANFIIANSQMVKFSAWQESKYTTSQVKQYIDFWENQEGQNIKKVILSGPRSKKNKKIINKKVDKPVVQVKIKKIKPEFLTVVGLLL